MASLETVNKLFRMGSVANLGGAILEKETIQLYCDLLEDIPDDVLQAAFLDHVASSVWFPKIAQLRECSINIMLNVNQIPPAAEAWGEVYKNMVRFGRNGEPEWDSELTAQTVKALGWSYLCMSTNSTADRARFIECYNEYKEREIKSANTLPQVKQLAEKMRPMLKDGKHE